MSEVDELKALLAQQQKRIERLELALVLICDPDQMATRLTEVDALLEKERHVWLQPFRDSEGRFFLRVESSVRASDG